MSGADDHGHEGTRRRLITTSQHFGVGGEPSPLVGGLRGLGKIGAAVAVLLAITAAIAAVVAVVY